MGFERIFQLWSWQSLQTFPDIGIKQFNKFTAVMSISSDRVWLFLANLANSIFTHNTQFSSKTLVFFFDIFRAGVFHCLLDLWFAWLICSRDTQKTKDYYSWHIWTIWEAHRKKLPLKSISIVLRFPLANIHSMQQLEWSYIVLMKSATRFSKHGE